MFSQRFTVRWSDLDANAHMRNTAYMEYSLQVRMAFFQANGYSVDSFNTMRFGPVVFREELIYLKELHMLDEFDVNILLGGLSPDGSRFIIENHIYRVRDGKEAANVRSEIGWLNLETRKLMPPPAELFKVVDALDKAENYVEIALPVRK
jgi:acyl-CoA thioester hydrolase